MIVQCEKCGKWFEDEYRTTICPHEAFPANDGNNNFRVHEDAYLSTQDPTAGFCSTLEAADESDHGVG